MKCNDCGLETHRCVTCNRSLMPDRTLPVDLPIGDNDAHRALLCWACYMAQPSAAKEDR